MQLQVAALGLLFVLVMARSTAWGWRRMRSGRFARDLTAAPAKATPPFTPPPAAIEMQPVVDWYGGNVHLAVGSLVVAVWLFTRETAWLRLLAWPAGLVALACAGMSVWAVWNELGTRYVADASGLHTRDRSGTKSLPWSRVSRVKLTEYWRGYGPSTAFRPTQLSSRMLDLLDARGSSMLTLHLPLRPAEASAAFEASLPAWTQRPTELGQVGK